MPNIWSVEVGDCTVIDRGKDCDVMIWDPPWDASILPAGGFARYRSVVAMCDARRLGDTIRTVGRTDIAWQFVWDCCSSWYTRNRPLKRHKSAIWFGDLNDWREDAFFLPKNNPQRVVRNSRGMCLAGDERGTRMSDLYPSPITSLHANGLTHKHSKPIEWLEHILTGIGAERVYDPCAGSGATIVASMRHGIGGSAVDVNAEAGFLTAAHGEPGKSVASVEQMSFDMCDFSF